MRNGAAVDYLECLVNDPLLERGVLDVGDAANLLHVVTRFLEWRHLPAVAIDGVRAGVVGGERQLLVATVAVEQLPQVGTAAADVFRRVERVAHAQLLCRGRHQLHQPHRAFWRERARVES